MHTEVTLTNAKFMLRRGALAGVAAIVFDSLQVLQVRSEVRVRRRRPALHVRYQRSVRLRN